MTGGGGVARQPRGRSRLIVRLLLLGALLVLLAPLYAFYGIYLSGRLALAQEAPSGEILRGFDFGPVWLEAGEVGRYYISAMLPQADTAVWHTTFEVLDLQRQPVFRQDEVRFIGDHQFTPGGVDRSQHQFTLQKETGYYYFRFRAHNGTFDPSVQAPPAVKFAIRQRVLHGATLWGPAAALLLLGLLLVGRGFLLISRLGDSGAPQPAADDSTPNRGSRRLASSS